MEIFQVRLKFARDVNGMLQTVKIHRLLAKHSKLTGSRDGVAYLPAIERKAGQFSKVSSEVVDVDFVVLKRFDAANKILPNLPSGALAQFVVVNGKLYARFEALIENSDAIASQNENALFG